MVALPRHPVIAPYVVQQCEDIPRLALEVVCFLALGLLSLGSFLSLLTRLGVYIASHLLFLRVAWWIFILIPRDSDGIGEFQDHVLQRNSGPRGWGAHSPPRPQVSYTALIYPQVTLHAFDSHHHAHFGHGRTLEPVLCKDPSLGPAFQVAPDGFLSKCPYPEFGGL